MDAACPRLFPAFAGIASNRPIADPKTVWLRTRSAWIPPMVARILRGPEFIAKRRCQKRSIGFRVKTSTHAWTELQSAQRTADLADVARRIAHAGSRILDGRIQLSAGTAQTQITCHLKCRRRSEIFAQCTDPPIVRQVAIIGRMVDEFSSFARMPNAVEANPRFLQRSS